MTHGRSVAADPGGFGQAPGSVVPPTVRLNGYHVPTAYGLSTVVAQVTVTPAAAGANNLTVPGMLARKQGALRPGLSRPDARRGHPVR